MNDGLQLIVEDDEGREEQLDCSRMAIVWQGCEIWIQPGENGQLLIGVDDKEGSNEYANLLLRPQATNLISMQLEFEPYDPLLEGCGPDCEH